MAAFIGFYNIRIERKVKFLFVKKKEKEVTFLKFCF
jgi:hypothetical protein